MLIHLSDYFSQANKSKSFSLDFAIGKLPYAYKAEVVTKKEPLELTISYKEKGKAVLTGGCRLEVTLPCDRCLVPTTLPVEVSFEREVVAPERLDEDPDQKDDQVFVEEYQLDVDKLMEEGIVINWPTEILCRDDCKGLCPKCGHNLNQGECGCDTFVPDPRLAGLADIMKQLEQ